MQTFTVAYIARQPGHGFRAIIEGQEYNVRETSPKRWHAIEAIGRIIRRDNWADNCDDAVCALHERCASVDAATAKHSPQGE